MAWMVIRVRGTIHARHDIRQTLEELRLTRANHATLLPEEPGFRGMLHKVQGYVTWGEAEPETVTLLLRERGETTDGRPLSAPNGENADAQSPTPSVDRVVESALRDGLLRAQDVKPLLRLRPPRGGWRSTKRPFGLGGALGYRGRAINDLARRMV
jgi:large subunit ribosomal protein L30